MIERQQIAAETFRDSGDEYDRVYVSRGSGFAEDVCIMFGRTARKIGIHASTGKFDLNIEKQPSLGSTQAVVKFGGPAPAPMANLLLRWIYLEFEDGEIFELGCGRFARKLLNLEGHSVHLSATGQEQSIVRIDNAGARKNATAV